MKPLYLTMEAFGSYGKRTAVDFRMPRQSIFLITGDTGAGKSTIFDAMSFALYGEASSISNKKDGQELQSQFAGPGTSPFVELTFQEGGEIYTVRRTPRHLRAKSRREGLTPQKETVSLILPDGSEYPAKETDAKIREIVGLTKEQFMQVAMIAQGEFMELLRADSDKKKAIFRKLFGTELYDAVQEEFGRRCQDKKAEIIQLISLCRADVSRIQTPGGETWQRLAMLCRAVSMPKDAAKDPLKSFSVTDVEEIVQLLEQLVTQLTEEARSLKNELNEAGEAGSAATTALAKGQEMLKAFDQLLTAQTTLAELSQAEAEIDRCSLLARQIKDACELQTVWKLWQKAAGVMTDMQAELETQQKALPGLREAAEAAEARKKQAETAAEAMLAEYTRLAESVRQALALFGDIAGAEKELKDAEAAETAARDAAQQAAEMLTRLEERERAWRGTESELRSVPEQMESWKNRSAEAEAVQAEIKAIMKDETLLAAQRARAEKAALCFSAAQTAYLTANQTYQEKYTAFLNAQAGFLAQSSLKPGQPCPVCGSCEHPSPCALADEHRELDREKIEKLQQEAKARGDELMSLSETSGKEAARYKELCVKQQEAMEKLRQRMAGSIDDLPEGWNIDAAAERWKEWRMHINAVRAELTQQMAALTEAQRNLAGVEAKKAELRSALDARQKEAEQAGNARTAASTRLTSLTAQKTYATPEAAETVRRGAEADRIAAEKQRDEARRQASDAAARRDRAQTIIADHEQKLPALTADAQETEAAYRRAMAEKKMTEEAWQPIAAAHNRAYAEALEQKVKAHGERRTAAEQQQKTMQALIGDQPRPELSVLQQKQQEAAALLQTLQDKAQRLHAMLDTDRRILGQLKPQMEERAKAIRAYDQLNMMYLRLKGKVTGGRMDIETYAQRYYLKRILRAANKRFIDMTGGQFELRLYDIEQAGVGTNHGLDLMVYSYVTRSSREIRTLSGGESFMAALALALGMADQIQESASAVHLDMMFIDEGFGSLDDHSRSQAVKVLKALAGGDRLIGIISHVTELKQEIDDQLIVTKHDDGSRIRWQLS